MNQSAFNSKNYHPNDYIPFQVTGLNPLGQSSLFILPHVQEQLNYYFENVGSNNYSGLLLKQRLEQLFPNANGTQALVNVNSRNQQARSIQVDGMLICYTLNLKGRRGVFIDDMVWVGKDKQDAQNGLYRVIKKPIGWIIEKDRVTGVNDDHLYIYEGSLKINLAAKMAGSVLNDTYKSDLGSKFTLSYAEPTMLKKRGWYPALAIMRNRNTDYQNTMGYLTSHIKRCSSKKMTDIVAQGNGCIYLKDSLKRMQAEQLSHLRVFLINPPFPITRFASSFDKVGLKYKNYGFVTSLGEFGSKIKGLGINSAIGNYAMTARYAEKKTNPDEQREETIKSVLPIVGAIKSVGIKASLDAFLTSVGGVPVNLCYTVLLSYWTKNERERNPLMSKSDLNAKATNKLFTKIKGKATASNSNNRISKR